MIVIVVIISIVIMSILTRPSLSLSLGKSSLVGPSGHRSAPESLQSPFCSPDVRRRVEAFLGMANVEDPETCTRSFSSARDRPKP